MPLSRHHKHDKLRKQLWSILHYGHGMSGHAFHLSLIIVIVLSLALLPLEFIPQLHQYQDALLTIEIFTAVFFTMEYVFRIYASPQRWRYVFSFYGIVDLLSIAPFYLGFLGTQYVQAIRLLRVIRVLKLGELQAAATEDEEEYTQRGVGLLPKEKVEYVVSRHPIYLFFACLPPLAATMAASSILLLFGEHPVSLASSICLFLFAMVFLWRAWLDFSYDVIYVTDRRLICQNQFILGRSINQVNYNAITNVKPYYTSWLGYFVGYGSIVIETMAAEPGHIELYTVHHHEKAAHVIMERCFGKVMPRTSANT